MALCLVGGLAAAAVLVLATRWLPRDHRPATTPLRFESLLAPYRPLLRDGTMRRLYGATVCGAVCWFGVVTYLGAFLVSDPGSWHWAGWAGLYDRWSRVLPGQPRGRRPSSQSATAAVGHQRLSRNRRLSRPGFLSPNRHTWVHHPHPTGGGADDGGRRRCHDHAPDNGDADWCRNYDDAKRVLVQPRRGRRKCYWRRTARPLRLRGPGSWISSLCYWGGRARAGAQQASVEQSIHSHGIQKEHVT